MDRKTCKPLAQSLHPKTFQHTSSLLPTATNILQLGRLPILLPVTCYGLKARKFLFSTREPKSYCPLLIILWAGKAQTVSPGPLQQVTVSQSTVYIHTFNKLFDSLPPVLRAQTFWVASTEQQNSQLIDSRVHSSINPAVINKPLFIYKYMLVKISAILNKRKSHYRRINFE